MTTKKAKKCTQCKGSGTIPEYDYVGYFGEQTCGQCLGSGKFVKLKPHIPVGYRTYED